MSDRLYPTEASIRTLLLRAFLFLFFFITVVSAIYDALDILSGRYILVFFDWASSPYREEASYVWLPEFIFRWVLWVTPLAILAYSYLIAPKKFLKYWQDLQQAEPEVYKVFTAEIEKQGIKKIPTAFLIPEDRTIHAEVSGYDEDPRLALTTKLVNELRNSTGELKAVVFHELSHILNREVRQLTTLKTFVNALKHYFMVFLAYQCIVALYYVSFIKASPAYERALLNSLARSTGITVIFIASCMLVTSILRMREYFADVGSIAMLRDADPLIAFIDRLDRENPQRGLLPKLWEVFSTHPLPKKRKDAIRRRTFLRPEAPFSLGTFFWYGATLSFVVLASIDIVISIALLGLRVGSGEADSFYESFGPYFYFIVEIILPSAVLILPVARMSIRKALSRFSRVTFAAAVYIWGLIAYFGASYFGKEVLGVYSLPDITRFSPLWPEYLSWSRDFIYRLSPPLLYRLDVFFGQLLPYVPFLSAAILEWIFLSGMLVAILIASSLLVIFVRLSLVRCFAVAYRMVSSFMTIKKRFFLVVAIEVMLISSAFIVQIPANTRRDSLSNWVRSNLSVSGASDPDSKSIVAIAHFFDGLSVGNNFYAIKSLALVGTLDQLRDARVNILGGNESIWQALIRWLVYHQAKDGSIRSGPYWWPEDVALTGVDSEYFVLSALEALHALEHVDREGAIRFALKSPVNGVIGTFYMVSSLKILDASRSANRSAILEFLSLSQFLDNSRTDLSALYWGGLGMRNDSDPDLEATYAATQTLMLLDGLDRIDSTAAVSWVMKHSNEDGGFSLNLILKSHYLEVGPDSSDIYGTFYAVKTLEALGRLNLLDKDRTVRYVLQCQKVTGGFAETPESKTVQPITTYMALESLYSLNAIGLLHQPFSVEQTITDILKQSPTILYILIVTSIFVDIVIYQRYVRRRRQPQFSEITSGSTLSKQS